jgi:Cu(I)/Ag(I) efflux system membrane fusion protein
MNLKILKKITQRDILLMVAMLVIGLLLGGFFGNKSQETEESHEHTEKVEEETIYTCSMHPQIRQNEPGQCPICAMDLVPVSSVESDDVDIDPDEIQMTESAIALANIQTFRVEKRNAVKEIHLLGKVKADERNKAELTARFNGRIEKLFINFTGQQVTKGQKLATIYSPELITAQKELLEAMKYKDSNPLFYKAARGKLRLWDLTNEQIDNIEQNAEPEMYFDILSPITGTVMKRNVALGDYVNEGTTLFEVIDLSRVWVMFEAYESDLPWIKTGDKIKFTLRSVPGKQFSGTVNYIDPFIDPATRITRLRVEVPNLQKKLKPEMFAKGVLESEIAANTNTLIIPKSAVLWTGKRSVVYVKVPDREMPSFLYREVVLGPEAGDFYVIHEGLNEGEEIAVNGVFKIDASAQLAEKTSMMNPEGEKVSLGHDHSMDDGNADMETTEDHSEHEDQSADLKHEMFEVSGNCSMCKDRIEEAALSLQGVNEAEWSEETKVLHISFDHSKVKLADIHMKIAEAGHDTELEKAPDDVYEALPACCLYRDSE